MKSLLFLILFSCSLPAYSNQIVYNIDYMQSTESKDFSNYHEPIKKSLIAAMNIVMNALDLKKDLKINILIEISDLKKYPNIKGAGAQSEEFVLYQSDKKYGNVYQQGLTDYLFNHKTLLSKKYHFILIINDKYLEQQLWFDPDSEKRLMEIPSKKVDAISIFIHEILHVIAFNGWLDSNTGISLSPNKAKSVYDTQVVKINNTLYFNGKNAVKVFGTMIPLTKKNYKHYGNSNAQGKELEGFVMYGDFYKFSHRFLLSDLDLAILKDCGLKIKKQL